MKIAIAGTQFAAKQTILLSNSRRYVSIMDWFGFQPQTFWRSRGMISDNICGQGFGKDGYSHVCIPCNISFSGSSAKVTVRTRLWASSGVNRTFCWAIIPMDLDFVFLGTGRAESELILSQGTFTVDAGGVHYQEFTFPVQNLPSGNFYIYWWRDNSNYGNIHISGDFEVSVYTETSAVSWKEATPYVFDGTQWKQATVWINRQKQWIQAQ